MTDTPRAIIWMAHNIVKKANRLDETAGDFKESMDSLEFLLSAGMYGRDWGHVAVARAEYEACA